MRLSVRKDSPFYDEAKVNACPLVFVNGERITGCFEASEEEGWADVWARDKATGKLIRNNVGDGAEMQRLEGKVEIRLP